MSLDRIMNAIAAETEDEWSEPEVDYSSDHRPQQPADSDMELESEEEDENEENEDDRETEDEEKYGDEEEDHDENGEEEEKEKKKESPDNYVAAVMALVREYVVVFFGRLARSGNYGAPDEPFMLYEPVHFPARCISLCAHVIPDGGLIRYFVRLSVRVPSGRMFTIRDLEIWSHAHDSEEAEFQACSCHLEDSISLFRRSVLRWSRYLPFRECANKECATLLLPCESPYCFECKHGLGRCDCAICLDGETPRRLVTTRCGHTFHRSCFRRIQPFESNKVKCPLCRAIVSPDG
jgi:Ring finger domain